MSNTGYSIFANYETTKLAISNPTILNLIFLVILLVVALISGQKRQTSFLDHSQTDQLKGLAILLIVLGHLWIHVSKKPAIPVLGDYAVSLFLLLSGFGLTMSLTKRKLTFRDFVSRRLKRVLLPYWLITIVFLTLDYYILGRNYSAKSIIYTLFGINFDLTTRQIDYVRWFITLLLIYYVAFYIIAKYFSDKLIIILFLFSFVLIFLRFILHILPFGEINELVAFPIGCLIALKLNIFSRYLEDNYILMIVCGASIIALLSFIILLTDQQSIISLRISNHLARDVLGITFCLFIILCTGAIGNFSYLSNFLILCGTISYELYLIHGPLLIKYDPILKLFPGNLIIMGFFIFLTIVLALSYFYNKSLVLLYKLSI